MLVTGKCSRHVLCLEFPISDQVEMVDTPKMTELQIPSKLENRQILDLCAFGDSGNLVVILYDKNHIVIFDLE